MADLIGTHLGQYEIVSLLGKGGMATVYRARQLNIERDVAVKIIKPDLAEAKDFSERFRREAKTIASLSHPHILKLFDYGQYGDLLYVVMELLSGGSLADQIRRGPLPLEHVTHILDQIASALDYAHAHGVIHRDLKPQNVLLDSEGNAQLTDFGIAKQITETSALTQSGVAMGTPTYMAPEQWCGLPIDARADIYALGILLFEMLAGRAPFSGDTPFRLMHAHVYEPPPSIRNFRTDLPDGVESVIARALAKDKEQRFSSAGKLAQVFRAALSGQVSSAATTRLGRVEAGPIGVLDLQHENQPTNRQPLARASHRRYLPLGLALGSGALLVLVGALFALANRQNLPGATIPPVIALPTVPALTPSPTNAPTLTPPPPQPGVERLDARGVAMVYVPAGCFLMGSDPSRDSQSAPPEQPQHNICLTRGFWIDKYEVTNEAYQQFIYDGGYRRREFWSEAGWQWKGTKNGPQDYDGANGLTMPRTGITWYEAEAYANWRGGRLPTEAEWEYAARGKDGRTFPWGNSFDGAKLNFCDKDCTLSGHDLNISDGYAEVAPAGSYPGGKSWVNAYDMAGNVWEWVADWYDETYYLQTSNVDPTGPASGTMRGMRGGSWFDIAPDNVSRVACRHGGELVSEWKNLGVRIVSNGPDLLTGTQSPTPQPNHNLALGKPAIASKSDQWPAKRAVDGQIDFSNGWGAGAPPPQWIEINLEATATVTEIRLRVGQSPDGQTVHQVFGRGPEEEFRLLNEFSGFTVDRQWLVYTPPSPWTGIQFVKVQTVQSPSWVTWLEIEVVGTFDQNDIN